MGAEHGARSPLTWPVCRDLLAETGSRARCAALAEQLWARHLDEQGGMCQSTCGVCSGLQHIVRPPQAKSVLRHWDPERVAETIIRVDWPGRGQPRPT